MHGIDDGAGGLARLKAWARRLKTDILALWIAARDSRTPWLPKLVAATVAAYALSPVDLIPDFIPILGYVDDLVIVPLGIALATRLMPSALMEEFRTKASNRSDRPRSASAAIFILFLWMTALTALWLRLS